MARNGWKLLGMIVLWTVLIATSLWIFVAFYWGWKSAKPTDGIYLYPIPDETQP